MDAIKELLNSKLSQVRFSARLFVAGIILSVTLFLLLIDSFKMYHSEITILVNMKSEVAIKQQQLLLNTISELPKTLSFYDRLLKFNPDVRDVSSNLSADKRKAKWNKMVSVKRVNEEGLVFDIAILAKRENDARLLVEKTARNLFDSVAFYYDIKKDIDLRIIDGPISETRVSGGYWLVLISVLGGFSLAALLNFILFVSKDHLLKSGNMIRKNFFADLGKKKKVPNDQEIEFLRGLYQKEQTEAPFVFEEKVLLESEEEKSKPQENIEEKPEIDPRFQEMKKLTKEIEPDKYPNFSEMPIRKKQEEVVPDNLPIADSSFLEQYNMPEDIVEEESTPISPEAPVIEEQTGDSGKKEPSPEELKRRLNQLLKGEI